LPILQQLGGTVLSLRQAALGTLVGTSWTQEVMSLNLSIPSDGLLKGHRGCPRCLRGRWL